MATTKPTFQNQTTKYLPAPRYNFDDILVPPGKYITGAYYATNNTLDGNSTGQTLFDYLGFVDVSAGNDPLPADIVYDYPPTLDIRYVNLPVYADNAAAASLAVGQLYRTAIGDLMVKF